MTKRLSFKLFIMYLAFGIASLVCVTLIVSYMSREYLINHYATSMYDEASYLARECRFTGQENYDSANLAEKSRDLHARVDCSVMLVQRDGQIIFDSHNGQTGQTIADFDPASTGSSRYQVDRFYELFAEDMVNVTVPVTGGFSTYGYIAVLMPLSSALADQHDIINISAVACLVMFLLSSVVLLWFHVNVSKPLREITSATREYAAGNLDKRINVSGEDEIGNLGATLNYMAYELANTEESQRKFISNISHDFRSPLTSIKGYLEAMLDGTIPPEKYEKYMKLVVSETERLTTLTQRTLALQSLESDGTLLELEDFDINQTIKDTALAFEGTCQQRRIFLDLTFCDDVVMVNADKSKIQQVLYNLIDNAIKFSPENSTIWVEVADRYEKVFVSVKDNGLGIPKDSQKKIWTRFYKADNSRGKDKKGTGLGLAICKDIIAAHGQNIDVISTEGAGSEFIFSLNKPVNTAAN